MWRLVALVSACALSLAGCGGTSRSGSNAGGGAGSGGGSMMTPSDAGATDGGATDGGATDSGAGAPAVDLCQGIANEYSAALDRARYCDPNRADGSEDPCTQVMPEGVECSCPTYVNPENSEAIALSERLQGKHAAGGCRAKQSCGECPVAEGAFCNGIGRCVSRIKQAPGAACLVKGVEYPSGSGGIPDPSSCNTCTCQDGALGCTLIGCDGEECPEGYVQSSQCAKCGGEDGCSVMEYGCLPACVDGACDGAVCVDGVCKAFCD